MKSLKEFDEELKKDQHFQIHYEMLPFIGSSFKESRILIISESHYVPLNKSIPTDEEWYFPKDIKELLTDIQCNTFTREIIEKIFSGKKPHRIFINLRNALKKSEHSFGIEHIGWYNFFQKPAFNKASINPTKLDYEVAHRVFEHLLFTLEPKLIIFTSVKSFDSIRSFLNWDREKQGYFYKSYNSKIDFVAHPNSAWWYRKSQKYLNKETNEKRSGQRKFIDLINKHCAKF